MSRLGILPDLVDFLSWKASAFHPSTKQMRGFCLISFSSANNHIVYFSFLQHTLIVFTVEQRGEEAMANKRRPKKTKAPYRRYGPGGLIRTEQRSSGEGADGAGDEDEDEDEEAEEASVMVRDSGTLWPRSQFSKVDVLSWALLRSALKPGEVLNIIPVDFKSENVTIPRLPVEILELVLKYVDELDPKYLLVNKTFYWLYLPLIYNKPKLDSHNFHMFVESISKPKNKVGQLVKTLDLSMIIQSGKNSYVSKVLRRCSENLEVFIAPQTSFGYAPLISLRGCKKIKVLDLGLVSETVNLSELFHAIQNLKRLTRLSFPRSSISCNEECDESYWPPNLWHLRLSGGISEKFLSDSIFPSTITRLEFAHCPLITEFAMYKMLLKYGENLTHLSVQYPMPGLKDNSLDFLFTYCPNLIFLQVFVDYCSKFLFSEDLLPKLSGRERPLKTLWIESSGGLGQSSKIHPDDLTIALMEDRLPCLKNVRVTSKLGWDEQNDDVVDLAALLDDNGGGLYVNYT